MQKFIDSSISKYLVTLVAQQFVDENHRKQSNSGRSYFSLPHYFIVHIS